MTGSGGHESPRSRFTCGTPVVAEEPISGRVSRHGTAELASVLVSANFGSMRKSADEHYFGRRVPFRGGGDLCRGWHKDPGL
jgi:hypothetical protein